ncbi:MAG: TatD family hydrolase [Thermosynechococcaceae cyanobacterium]
MQLIDTHVHINFDTFAPDLDGIAQRWRDAGVVRLVHSCVEPSEFPDIQRLVQRFPELHCAVGLHPLDMDKWTSRTAEQIRDCAQSGERVVAIGETGLDLFKASDRHQQEQSLIAHLQIAQDLGLPVILHCRDAAGPMAELLRQFWAEQGTVQGVMHCWGGTPEETQLFLDLGFYISFSGIVTFKNAKQVHASAQMVPCDRILIETDCPFLTPEPKRKQRRNEPAHVYHVAEKVAQLREIPLEDLAAQTTANACHLFQLSVPAPALAF